MTDELTPQSPAIAAITKHYGLSLERAKDDDLRLLIRRLQIHLSFQNEPMILETFDGFIQKSAKVTFSNDSEGLRYLSKIALTLADRLEF